MNLAQTQARLKAYLLDPEATPDDVLPLLANGFGRTREQRLEIYHHAYRARLHEALATVFERTWVYLGDDEFAAMVSGYIEAHPSRQSNLRDYGDRFPAFLADRMRDDPEVSELAAMDWNLHLAFDAPDVSCLAAEELANRDESDWEHTGFAFQPGLAITVFEWNVVDVWHALDQEQTPPAAVRLERPIACLFWRQELRSQFRSLHPAEHALLAALLRGASFGSACTRLADDWPDACAMLGPWLQGWLANGLLSRLVPVAALKVRL